MRIAIPVENGSVCMHFGHCAEFIFADVDQNTRTISSLSSKTPPAHAPGVLPQWLKREGADIVIAGGMGMRAQNLFTEAGIKVEVGAPPIQAKKAIQEYLDGTLSTGQNVCDH